MRFEKPETLYQIDQVDQVNRFNRKSLLYRLLLFLTFFAMVLFGSWEMEASEVGQSKSELPVKVLILGDSLTEGYGIAKEEAYPNILEKKLKLKNIQVKILNSGISGSTTASAPKRLKWHLRKKPDVLFIALGANDGLRGVKTESMFKNLDGTITMAKKEGIYVMLAQMKLPMNYGHKYRSDFEKVYQDLEKKHSIMRVPFLLEGVAAIKNLNLSDGIHPNEKGHQKIAETILPYMEKALTEFKK